jgi:hypothetical protein
MNSGIDVFLEAPTLEMINPRDIAHHLALINRFNGATETPYSVAQHSVLVADLLFAKKQPAHVCLWGLLHDAHEAYLGDVTTPVKAAVFGALPVPSHWDHLSHHFDLTIQHRFGIAINPAEEREVKLADLTALASEWRDLMQGTCPLAAKPAPHRVKPMAWHRAEDMFIKTFNTYARHLNLEEA